MTTSFPTTIARRAAAVLVLLASLLCAFAGSAHALPTNTGGNNDPEPGSAPPVARFTISPNPALTSEIPVLTQARAARVIDVERFGENAVTFNASASTDDTGITKYQWDLDGNGTYEKTTTTPKTTRSYGNPGTFTIRLRVTDDNNKTDTESHVLIVHKRPVAKITPSTSVALIGDTLTYSAAGSSDDNGINHFEWDLDGNGTFETNTGTTPTASRSYGSIGQRTVALKVVDTYGAAGTASVKVLIHRTPTAAFTAAPSPAFVGEQVTFDGSSSSDDESVAKYEWDLDGDGTFETNSAASPTTTHTYTQPATTTVRLRVTDNRGVSDVATRSLTVQPRPPVVKDTTAPRVRILTATAKMTRKGFVAVKVSCPRTERLCSGRLSLRSLGARSSALGGKSLRIGGGQTATLRVKLSKTKQRLVRKHRSVSALATARVRDAAGNAGTASKRLKIRR